MPNISPSKHFLRRKLYFLVIAVVGVIWTLVSLGLILNIWLNKLLISDEEIVNSSRYNYVVNQCSNPQIWDPQDIKKEMDTEAIAVCKKEAKANIIASRDIDTKTDLINSISRGVLFLILMLTHLPIFLKTTKKE